MWALLSQFNVDCFKVRSPLECESKISKTRTAIVLLVRQKWKGLLIQEARRRSSYIGMSISNKYAVETLLWLVDFYYYVNRKQSVPWNGWWETNATLPTLMLFKQSSLKWHFFFIKLTSKIPWIPSSCAVDLKFNSFCLFQTEKHFQ